MKSAGGLRENLNSNPLAQAAVIGVLGLLVAFLLLTRMGGGSEDPAVTTTPTTDAAATDASAADSATSDSAADPAAPTDPAADAAAAADPAADAAAAGKFVAGPGLPAPVVAAYARGDTVVILVNRHGGIDDRELRKVTKQLQGRQDVALFVTTPKHVSDYSRIVGGVDIDRAPALIVLSPRSVSGSGAPVASISYGFRGYDSVVQAVRNARYDGKELPYYP
ncbi:MAG: hypothetical protein ABI726_04475 [bacterium]